MSSSSVNCGEFLNLTNNFRRMNLVLVVRFLLYLESVQRKLIYFDSIVDKDSSVQ